MRKHEVIFYAFCPKSKVKMGSDEYEKYFNCPVFIPIKPLIYITGNPIPAPDSPKYCEHCGSGLTWIQRKCSCGKAAGKFFCVFCGDKIEEIGLETFKKA